MAVCELRKFGAGLPPNVRDISRLHAALLPTSPVTLLGARFRERFYYKDLPEMGLIFGAVAYVEECPAGFIAATHDSDGFMGEALARKWPKVAWIVGVALAADPRRFAAVWEVLCIMRDRARSKERVGKGEILSVGVLPAYRSGGAPGIARELARIVMETFRDRGVRQVCAVVDADNQRSLRFFEKLGFRVSHAPLRGWRRPSLELHWEPECEGP